MKVLSKSKIIILILLFFLLVLLFVCFYSFNKLKASQRLNSELRNSLNSAMSAIETENSSNIPIPGTKREMIMSKDVENGKLVAYRLADDWSNDLNAGVFAIRLESGSYWPVIFSSASVAYAPSNPDENKLFEILNINELWVVNDQTNKIDVYEFTTEKKVINTTSLSSIKYIKSIDLPGYVVGGIYGIKCELTMCTIYTARHQESGCTMKLNTIDEIYSDINCSDMIGEFIPEKL